MYAHHIFYVLVVLVVIIGCAVMEQKILMKVQAVQDASNLVQSNYNNHE